MKRRQLNKRAETIVGRFALAALGALSIGAMSFVVLRDFSAPAITAAAHLPALPSARPPEPPNAAPEAAREPQERADRNISREGYTLVSAGALFVPSSFASADGTFDLLIHFHGNAELVAESVAAAGLSALVLVVNVGVGSGAYDTRYAAPAMLDFDVARVVETAAARGLRGARLGRLALAAWSAGYGAIGRILARDEAFSRVSAVLLCDALHSNFVDKGSREVDMERIAPFVRFAEKAAAGEKLFVMTHSEIGEFRYATTTETSDAILRVIGIERSRTIGWPDRPSFPLGRAVMSTERWLEQRSEARRGELRIAGYRGFKEDDHIAHLAQMSSTVLPSLVEYWKRR
ncbi:hypothetical protein [Polyangium jinanense]|uniref:Alpha/beta hydrolase n=1 Tax=Polyangium jinanense TaxID=2829994 RepID=A0A9X3XA08_9BACT|nr:hypothetical protein [Polyangium jinanense]MDC3958699.1 hypothetical protein [Polyangium jinanense]MDC3985320.1 hypothetical protein [Polyangium jinanense]